MRLTMAELWGKPYAKQTKAFGNKRIKIMAINY